MATSLDNVIAQMTALGMPDISPHELQLDTGRWVRYGPRKKAYYRISRRVSRAGNEYYAGAFGYKGQGPFTVEYEGPQLTAAEIEDLRRKRERDAALEARRRAIDAQRAADRALDTWRESAPSGASPYLERKKVAIDGGWVRYLGDLVVVPMVRHDLPEGERLKGVQIIRPNGDKRFTAGMEKPGCAAVLGMHLEGAPILLCEGLATAASCWLALDRHYRVVVAFDAGNLLPVAQIMRARHPRSPMLICADDDFLTDGNPGRTKACQAARAVDNCGVTFPAFTHRGERKLTDFNDLQLDSGLPTVAAQIHLAMKWLGKF